LIDISAQVSLYPLGQEDLSPAIDEALNIFRYHDLKVTPGSMSTLVFGDDAAVFSALQEAFYHAAKERRVVMVTTFSNACLASKSEAEQ
jgi:uncharacterized protein YqgV (UPF0045/DUF77 family)